MRSAGRVYGGTRPAERMRARAPSRAYAANEISRLPIGRARHLCAPIRDALARACLPVRAWSLRDDALARACASVLPSMRVRAVAHPCASCMRVVVLASVCASPYAIARGCETYPLQEGAQSHVRVFAVCGRVVREHAREAGVPDRAAAEFRAPRANSCPAYGRGGPIRRAALQVSPHAPVWGVGLFAYQIGVQHRLGTGARPCVRRWAGCGSRASCTRAVRAASG